MGVKIYLLIEQCRGLGGICPLCSYVAKDSVNHFLAKERVCSFALVENRKSSIKPRRAYLFLWSWRGT